MDLKGSDSAFSSLPPPLRKTGWGVKFKAALTCIYAAESDFFRSPAFHGGGLPFELHRIRNDQLTTLKCVAALLAEDAPLRRIIVIHDVIENRRLEREGFDAAKDSDADIHCVLLIFSELELFPPSTAPGGMG